MVKSQIVRGKIIFLACMPSLIQCFAAIAGCIREKAKIDITRPPLTDILVKYVFELRRTCPNYGWKNDLTVYF